MLRKLSALKGASVHATDGEIGSVQDFYFDDTRWVVRYAVVATGNWLTSRRVVLPVMSFLPLASDGRVAVRLTRDQIRLSPDLASHPEISRTLEAELLSFYGFPYYWAGDALWGRASNPLVAAEQAAGHVNAPDAGAGSAEVHLRSARDVIGYHLHARDGEIGHVDDFLIDPLTWAIAGILIDTSNAIGGRAVVLDPSSIERVDWIGQHVRVALSRATIATAPEYDARSRVGSPS